MTIFTMSSCIAPVEAFRVDQVDGFGSGAVIQQLFIVGVFVPHIHLFLQELVALPQRRILDPFDLPTV